MRTPSAEKDSLLRPTVHEKIVYQILKKEFFLPHPLYLDIEQGEVGEDIYPAGTVSKKYFCAR